MSVIAIHKKSFAVINLKSVDSVTVSDGNIVVHGISTTGTGTAQNYTFDNDDYLISVVND